MNDLENSVYSIISSKWPRPLTQLYLTILLLSAKSKETVCSGPSKSHMLPGGWKNQRLRHALHPESICEFSAGCFIGLVGLLHNTSFYRCQFHFHYLHSHNFHRLPVLHFSRLHAPCCFHELSHYFSACHTIIVLSIMCCFVLFQAQTPLLRFVVRQFNKSTTNRSNGVCASVD